MGLNHDEPSIIIYYNNTIGIIFIVRSPVSITMQGQRGIFVSFGNASGAVPAFPPLKLIGKSAFLTRPKLNDYTVTREELLERANDIFGWLQDGRLKVTVDRAFKLDDVQEGHRYLEAGKSKGKVLYEI